MNLYSAILIFMSLYSLSIGIPINLENPEEGYFYEGDIAGIINTKGAFQKPNQDAVLWPKGEVPYFIDSKSSFSKQDLLVIESGLKHIENMTTIDNKQVIKFIKLKDEKAMGTKYKHAIKVIRESGCWSFIGQLTYTKIQELSIGQGCATLGHVAHEFVHALGFWHEQSRPDRDIWVTINYDNVKSGYESDFDKYSKSEIGLLEFPYDYNSIMHYGPNFFSKNGKPTITTNIKGAVIGNRKALTIFDAYEIIAAYGGKSIPDLLNRLASKGYIHTTTTTTSTTKI